MNKEVGYSITLGCTNRLLVIDLSRYLGKVLRKMKCFECLLDRASL